VNRLRTLLVLGAMTAVAIVSSVTPFMIVGWG
jgi:hypothetical protein